MRSQRVFTYSTLGQRFVCGKVAADQRELLVVATLYRDATLAAHKKDCVARTKVAWRIVLGQRSQGLTCSAALGAGVGNLLCRRSAGRRSDRRERRGLERCSLCRGRSGRRRVAWLASRRSIARRKFIRGLALASAPVLDRLAPLLVRPPLAADEGCSALTRRRGLDRYLRWQTVAAVWFRSRPFSRPCRSRWANSTSMYSTRAF